MDRNEYVRDAMFHPEQEPLTILPEEPIYADTKQECFEEVKTTIPFYCVVNIPHGFEYVPNGTHKIAYNLDCLSVIEEQCRKTIQVEGGGPCFVQAAIPEKCRKNSRGAQLLVLNVNFGISRR